MSALSRRIKTVFGTGANEPQLSKESMPTVAGELAEDDLFDRVWDVVYAFCSAMCCLFDDGAPTQESYDSLVDELTELLKSAFTAQGDGDQKGMKSALDRFVGHAASYPALLSRLVDASPLIKDTHDQLQAAQKHRQAECGIAPKDGGHLTCPSGFKQWANEPGNWGDWTNFAYPIGDKAHADNAASRWGDEHNRAKYSAQEQKLISARIEKAQAKFGESDNDDTSKGLTVDATKQGEPGAVTPEPKDAEVEESKGQKAPVEEPKAAAATEEPKDETKSQLDALTKTVADLAEIVKGLVAKPAEAPVDEAAAKQAELDRVNAELEQKRAEAEDLAQKAAEARASYEALMQKAQPSPLQTAPEAPMSELQKFLVTPGFDSTVPPPSEFAGKSLTDFLR